MEIVTRRENSIKNFRFQGCDLFERQIVTNWQCRIGGIVDRLRNHCAAMGNASQETLVFSDSHKIRTCDSGEQHSQNMTFIIKDGRRDLPAL
jgi:hypothetical protein